MWLDDARRDLQYAARPLRASPGFTADAYPILGRPFTADDEQPGGDRVVILSYGAWQRYFAGDSQAIGRSIRFNGTGRFSAGIALDAD